VGPSRVAELDVEPGALLVAYTDGLVERRDEDIDVSIGRLVDACDRLVDPAPTAVADALIEQLIGSDVAPDDVALVVVRFD
jgi:serine phosphatase RsbU (regulator of sigma subunit)